MKCGIYAFAPNSLIFHDGQGLKVVTLRPVKWVTLKWFLFGVHPYQLTLDFAFFFFKF